MDFKKAKEIFNLLYQDINGYQISFEARKKMGYYDKSLTYGEINFDSFYEIIKTVNPKKEDIFYDLGSGTGKAVFASHLLFDFKKSIRIEILPDLYHMAVSLQQKYEKEIKQSLTDKNEGKIEFILGDILRIDFFDADILFANSTCFPQELVNYLEMSFLKLKKGAKIIMLTQTLINQDFKLISSKLYQQSWGEATVNFYEKVK